MMLEISINFFSNFLLLVLPVFKVNKVVCVSFHDFVVYDVMLPLSCLQTAVF